MTEYYSVEVNLRLKLYKIILQKYCGANVTVLWLIPISIEDGQHSMFPLNNAIDGYVNSCACGIMLGMTLVLLCQLRPDWLGGNFPQSRADLLKLACSTLNTQDLHLASHEGDTFDCR